jgi:hypothetical protein
MALGLAIVVAKGHARQCDYSRSPAEKLFSQYGRSFHLAEATNPFHSLQHSNEQSQMIWIIFRSNCLLKEQQSYDLFSRHCKSNSNL